MTDKKKIRDFVPQVKNPNLHNTFGMRLLEKSIQNDGWIGAQTAAKDGEIIAGSARQEIAIEKFTDKDGKEVEPIIVESDGSRPVIIVRTDIENADTARARRLSAAENQIAKSNYNPDFELLKEWGGEDEQIKKLFSDDEWREGTGEEKPQVDAEPQIDRAAELAEKWQTASGQLWKLGDHRLLIGDCTVRENVERLMGGERAEIMVTDPPYGIEYDPTWRAEAGVNKNKEKMGKVENDDIADWTLAWELFTGDVAYVYHAGIMSGVVQNSLENCGLKIRQQIIWNKDRMALSRGDYHWKHEPCWYAVREGKPSNRTDDRKQVTVWDIPSRDDSGHGHGTQKPIECMARPIRNHNLNIVYEPFAGSGTTIIAAHNLNRRCYAMEISEKYGAVILERFFTATGITPELVE